MTMHQSIKEVAWDIYLERLKNGISGTPEGDWEAAREKLGISHADVQVEAWYIYLNRQWKNLPGTPEGDWFTAESNRWLSEFRRKARADRRHLMVA